MYVLFSFCLSCAADAFANQTGNRLDSEIEKFYNYHHSTKELGLMFSIVHVLLVLDFFVLFAMFTTGLISCLLYISCCNELYNKLCNLCHRVKSFFCCICKKKSRKPYKLAAAIEDLNTASKNLHDTKKMVEDSEKLMAVVDELHDNVKDTKQLKNLSEKFHKMSQAINNGLSNDQKDLCNEIFKMIQKAINGKLTRVLTISLEKGLEALIKSLKVGSAT